MSLTLDINCGVLCRGCRKTSEETNRMIFLFDNFHVEDKKSVEFKTIYDLFARYTLLEIDESDQGTSYICAECYEMLSNFHDFRKRCIASHLEFLRRKHLLNEFEQPIDNLVTPTMNRDICIKQETGNDDDDGDDTTSKFNSVDEMNTRSTDESDAEMDNAPVVEHYNYGSPDEDINIPDSSEPLQQEQQQHLLCEACGKVFTEECSYEKHLLTHISDLILYSCSQCEKEYTTRGNLKLHMDLKHPADENAINKLRCHICSKLLSAEQNLRQHLLRHEGKRDYVCTVCGAKKTTKAELKRHVNRHTKEREYPCDICSRIFYGGYELSRHKNVVHHGIKKYKCTQCEKSFGLLSTLNAHMTTHSDKSFKCDICDKEYARLDLVKAHIKRQHQKPKKKQT